jgi:cytidylate kinase
MYRAVAWAALRGGAETAEQVEGLLPGLGMEVVADPDGFVVLINGRALSTELRDPAVGKRASQIAKFPGVRAWLVERQRAEARDGAVLEGRDIGTVVLPDADVKLFVTAPEEVRMERRAHQLGTALDARITEDIRDRDRRDSQRSASPLRAAEDAVVIDTGGEEPADSLRRMLETVAARLGDR